MKIAIYTSGRFHLLDLARELSANGHKVTFYTLVPVKRCRAFKLDGIKIVSFFAIMSPLLAVIKYAPISNQQRNKLYRGSDAVLDFLASRCVPDCDMIIALSGVFLKTLQQAQKRKIPVIVERGSKHIEAQAEILAAFPKAKQVLPWDIRRELAGYALADRISVAAEHVAKTFRIRGFADEKIWINPYGVDLSMFPPTPKPLDGKDVFDVLMVGGWSYQKGCDLLIKACRKLNLRLLHVGSISDLEFPSDADFLHIDPVEQRNLWQYYSMSKVFALPSRQEGLALVQAQALACGLPVVCSPDTGGSELGKLLGDSRFVVEMRDGSQAALEEALLAGLALAEEQPAGQLRNYAGEAIGNLSWQAYGKRYSDRINRWLGAEKKY